MIPGWQGKLSFLAICLFFIGWTLLSIRNEAKLERRLEEAEARLEEAVQNQEIAMRSVEAAMQEREKIQKQVREKNRELENVLEENCDWNGICVPDDVASLLKSGAENLRLSSAGNPAQGH